MGVAGMPRGLKPVQMSPDPRLKPVGADEDGAAFGPTIGERRRHAPVVLGHSPERRVQVKVIRPEFFIQEVEQVCAADRDWHRTQRPPTLSHVEVVEYLAMRVTHLEPLKLVSAGVRSLRHSQPGQRQGARVPQDVAATVLGPPSCAGLVHDGLKASVSQRDCRCGAADPTANDEYALVTCHVVLRRSPRHDTA